MGPAGAGSLAQVVNAAIANKGRFEQMREFFGDVGGGDKAGVWEGTPQLSDPSSAPRPNARSSSC